jgi:hypothetical protein
MKTNNKHTPVVDSNIRTEDIKWTREHQNPRISHHIEEQGGTKAHAAWKAVEGDS